MDRLPMCSGVVTAESSAGTAILTSSGQEARK
jgi:hypothetical protein